MALGDIQIYRQASSGGGSGSRTINAKASANAIQAGEPVMIVAGASTVIPNQSSNLLLVGNMTTSSSAFVPYSVTGTGLLGIAQTTATNTSTAAGVVEYTPATSGTTWLIDANVSANVNTQTKYNALVGTRVLIDLTSGNYTMLTTDAATNGCIIQPLDIFKFPGKIAFVFADGVYANI